MIHLKNNTVPFLMILTVLCSCSHPPSQFWPQNGSAFHNKTWTVPLSDSLKVLVKQDGFWVLPEPMEGADVNSSVSLHRKSGWRRFHKQLGRVDQEVVHERNSVQMEFYRFQKGKVLLIGMTSPDSIKSLTVFDPPIEIWPGGKVFTEKKCTSEGITRVWDSLQKTFNAGQKTRVTVVFKEQGLVQLGPDSRRAVLCDMSMSQDKTVGFGGADLIVPDAVMVQSHVLLAEGIGPVLEWGIRVKVKEERGDGKMKDVPGISEPEREFYIEINVHERVKGRN